MARAGQLAGTGARSTGSTSMGHLQSPCRDNPDRLTVYFVALVYKLLDIRDKIKCLAACADGSQLMTSEYSGSSAFPVCLCYSLKIHVGQHQQSTRVGSWHEAPRRLHSSQPSSARKQIPNCENLLVEITPTQAAIPLLPVLLHACIS
jgi:hypothetical protein